MKGRTYALAGALAIAAATLGLAVNGTQADARRDASKSRVRARWSWPKMPLPSAGDLAPRS